jgi:hypothetical protein
MTHTSVRILCTGIDGYHKCMALLAAAGYSDTAGTPESYAKGILDRDKILVIAAFSDMTVFVGAFYATRARRNINTDTFVTREVVHSKDVSLATVKGFWNKKKKRR